jgi:hypothetical protein
MEARAKIEEDLFTRVPLSKTERRRAKATTRSMNSLQNVGDFGDDVADLVEVAEELEGQRGKRQRLVDSVTLASGSEARKNQKPVSGEQDVPLRDSLGVRVPLFFLFPFPFRGGVSYFFSLFAFRIVRSVDGSPPWSLGVKNDAIRTHSLAEVRRARRVAAAGADTRRRAETPPNIALSFSTANFSISQSRLEPPSLTLREPRLLRRLVFASYSPQDRRNKYERGVNKKLAARAAEEHGMYDDEAGPAKTKPFVEEDEAYVSAAAARDERRAAKEEKYRRRAGIVAAMEEEMDVDEKRDVGGKIMANRGLTPHRNKDHKNPRKRLRGKFEKAVVRRKGQVRSMREDQGGYGGEASGIKTSVTKSRKFGA